MRYGHTNVVLLGRRGVLKIRALVPRTAEDRQTGLRGVRFLPPGTGMLFDFDLDTAPTLTMKGVPIPLDMLFIGPASSILAIVHACPGQSRISGPIRSRYVLEVPGGYARKHGIGPGQRVQIRQD